MGKNEYRPNEESDDTKFSKNRIKWLIVLGLLIPIYLFSRQPDFVNEIIEFGEEMVDGIMDANEELDDHDADDQDDNYDDLDEDDNEFDD